MPREGVPYPERVLCSLKNTIAMIEQKLGLKIEKLNGVGPDPSGNVTLVSDDAALTIEEDASQHLVTIGLDRAELPSAAVTSVNGETGAVSLDASEIPYNDPDGYTDDVEEKLNVLTGVQNALQLSINQERTRAQNAESGLQTNINTVTASLPSAAAAAVAADPSVVRTSGNQNILDIKTVPTQTTGSYSQQIANSQKVRNELDGYQYMMRTINDQSFTGDKIGETNASTSGAGSIPHILMEKALNFNNASFIPSGNRYIYLPGALLDNAGVLIAGIRIQIASSSGGRIIFQLAAAKSDGTSSLKTIAEYNRTTDTWS